ncbi:TonB-dependent receptor [Parvularcula sp. ZS-1/3]|uniref:TonB-dependent receptor n=1 Tax=Parvularcula mediterranea TaxID=2732508 RepID=A0A7Y3RLD9_9PROT|nr:TonB-dependent receptor [Parvularcula mediterranea]NNU16150.1 TonB-dependent receptor [Parvularcula mediterranea]
MKQLLLSSAAASIIASSFAVATPAFAQETAADGEIRDEITVTARRRGESLQDVPLAVTSISGEQLENLGAPDITYVAQTTPNVTLEVSRGTNTTLTAFIRGVGQQDPVAGFENGVGIYVDDVYLNRPQGVVLDLYNVERIEVLRGPQGTLYGRNTIGGAVKYVTKRLGDEPSLKLRGTVGSFNQQDVLVSAELPVTDTLRVGGTIASFQRDGFGENLTTGAENYDKDITAARATVEFEPNERLFVRLSGDILADDSSIRGGFREIPNLADPSMPRINDRFDTAGGITGPNELDAWGAALVGEYKLTDQLTIKSITSVREDETVTQIDFDALPAPDLDVPAIYENEQFTQEVQLTYEGDYVSGVGGLFYIDANAVTNFDVLLGTLIPTLPGFNANTFGDVDTESWAVFGDFSFDLEEMFGLTGFELSLGGRYTEDERTSRVLRQSYLSGRTPALGGDPNAQIPFGAPTSDFNGSQTFTNFDPRVSLAYELNSDHNFYVTYSQGFKGGGFDPRGQTTAAPDVNGDMVVSQDEIFDFMQFDQETVNSYEAGWKSRVLDGRLSNNLAVFFADYTDIQIPGSFGGQDANGNQTFVGVTTNAGAAEFFGVELEGSMLWSDDLTGVGDTFSTAYSLGVIDAEYTEFEALVGGQPTDVSDLRVVQNTPDTTASLTTTYTRPLNGGTLSILTVTSYRSEVNQFEIPNAFIDQDEYALVDASLVWQREDGGLTIGLHGKNLLDKEYRVAGYNFLAQNQDGSFIDPLTSTLGTTGVATSFYGPPRQVFATVELSF